MQVNRAATDQLASGQTVLASDGLTSINFTYKPGVFLKHWTYDGQGRLIRVLSPYPDPDSAGSQRRSESFYYDGIRRIQEVIADPVISLGGATGTGDPELGDAAGVAQGGSGQPLDPEGTPIVVELATPSTLFLNREYIWGPGDRGVDELLVQYDWQRNPWGAITDDGGDLVAL